jgi:hypothetical protein
MANPTIYLAPNLAAKPQLGNVQMGHFTGCFATGGEECSCLRGGIA